MNQILDKISKALRLGENNSNENEAQNAILVAQKLMAKYRITQEDINDFVNEKDNQDVEVIEEKTAKEVNNDKWKRSLMITIARNFRCDAYYRGGKLVIVGEKEDILISKRIYLYAKQSIFNNFKTFFKEHYEPYELDNSVRNKLKREYALGFINGLSEKFEKQKENSELSLVVINPNVKKYINNIKFTGVHRSRKSDITNQYCYQQGKEDGRNLADIDTQMEGVG